MTAQPQSGLNVPTGVFARLAAAVATACWLLVIECTSRTARSEKRPLLRNADSARKPSRAQLDLTQHHEREACLSARTHNLEAESDKTVGSPPRSRRERRAPGGDGRGGVAQGGMLGGSDMTR